MTKEQLSRGPWKVECVEAGAFLSGDNWLIASLGEDHEGVKWYITTDCVPASRATSEPEADAKAIVEWRNRPMTKKMFMYFENQDGGMDLFEVRTPTDLSGLYGWGRPVCKEDDDALVAWMDRAEIGEMRTHRLGALVRLKDQE